jgi:hypothetical protein
VERLLKIFPKIKVLFMSGYTQDSPFYFDTLGSQVGLIMKPFPPNVLLMKVREVMNAVDTPMPSRLSKLDEGSVSPDARCASSDLEQRREITPPASPRPSIL